VDPKKKIGGITFKSRGNRLGKRFRCELPVLGKGGRGHGRVRGGKRGFCLQTREGKLVWDSFFNYLRIWVRVESGGVWGSGVVREKQEILAIASPVITWPFKDRSS